MYRAGMNGFCFQLFLKKAMSTQYVKNIFLLLLIFALTAGVSASENPLIYSEVDQYKENHYRVKLLIKIPAHPDAVINELQRYSKIQDLHEDIISSKVISYENNVSQIEVISNRCILFICFPIVQTMNFVRINNRTLEASIIPQKSDFLSGHMRWFVTLSSEGSLLEYTGEFEPDFWVPPLIGPWVVEMDLATASVEVIQALAERITGKPQQRISPWSEEGTSAWQ